MEEESPDEVYFAPVYQLCWGKLGRVSSWWPCLRAAAIDTRSKRRVYWLGTGEFTQHLKDAQIKDFIRDFNICYDVTKKRSYQEACLQGVQILARCLGEELTEADDFCMWLMKNEAKLVADGVYLTESQTEELISNITEAWKPKEDEWQEDASEVSSSPPPTSSNLVQCKYCSKQFAAGSNGLRFHEWTVHEGWRQKCLGCGKLSFLYSRGHQYSCSAASKLASKGKPWRIQVRMPSLISPPVEAASTSPSQPSTGESGSDPQQPTAEPEEDAQQEMDDGSERAREECAKRSCHVVMRAEKQMAKKSTWVLQRFIKKQLCEDPTGASPKASTANGSMYQEPIARMLSMEINRCLYCPYKAQTIDELRSHSELHGNVYNAFPCDHCSVREASQALLDQHTEVHFAPKFQQPAKRGRIKKTYSAPPLINKCGFCGRRFECPTEWMLHQRMHVSFMK